MIFGVAVDLPEIVKLRISQNIFDAQHRGHHGVILIVVLMHAVAADQMQIRITVVEFLANGGDVPRVIVVVNRIRFLLTNDAAIDKVPFPGQSNLNQLAPGEFDQIGIARIPQPVVLEAEIFETVTNLIGIRNHLRRPGAEVLNATNFDAWIVNVDPIVIKHPSISQDQHDREKIAIPEAFGRAFRSFSY